MGNQQDKLKKFIPHSKEQQQYQSPHGQQQQPSPQGCATHNLFKFDEIQFDSRFDSGNLKLVKQAAPDRYDIWVANDCYKTKYEVKGGGCWFHFKVSGVDLHGESSKTIVFRIMNMKGGQLNNYKNQKMVPVFQSPSKDATWKYLPTPIKNFKKAGYNLEFEFSYTFSGAECQAGVFFAFSFPYSYTDCQNLVSHLEETFNNHPYVYFHRELLCYSLEGRRVDLLTITGHDHSAYEHHPEIEPMLVDLFPEQHQLKEPATLNNKHLHRPFKFKNKKYVFLTARVHPGETPANYILEGFILSLLQNPEDPVNRVLLQNFVFVIIPMLNPDGVYRGYTRTDSVGMNWQFFYHRTEESHHKYRVPHGVLEVAKSLNKNNQLVLYIDLHAHSNKDAGFVYGCWHDDYQCRAEERLFARLLDVYSQNFDYNICEFGMKQGWHNPDPKKLGVVIREIRQQAGVLHSYTLETSYHVTRKDPHRYFLQANPEKKLDRTRYRKIGMAEFREIGQGIKNAILEMFGSHPNSKLPSTFFGNKQELHNYIVQVMKDSWKPKPQVVEKKEEEGKIPDTGMQIVK